MRPECGGVKDDRSDRCDLYDDESFCHFYGDTWEGEDGVFRGGMDVKCITYCTQRTIKKQRINDSMNPLYMERLCRWCETEFKGEIRGLYNSVYNPEGIIVCGDGSKYDPVSKIKIDKDGNVIS